MSVTHGLHRAGPDEEVPTDTLLAVRAGRLFDGERTIGPGTVLIGDGRIVDIDTTGATPPARAQVLDLGSDVFLLPGLIDAHVHLAFDASADVAASIGAVNDEQLLTQMAQAARQALRASAVVTAISSVESPTARKRYAQRYASGPSAAVRW